MHIDFARIIDSGYNRIMPLHGKHPFTPGLPHGSWIPLRKNPPTDSLVSRWQEDFDSKKIYTNDKGEDVSCDGVGLITGPEVGVGLFDWDCFDHHPELLAVVEELVPDLQNLKRIGFAPKWGSFFKPTPSYLKRSPIFLKNGDLIEIKCQDGYAVLDGTHPDTKQPYIWLDGNHLIDVDKETLPTLPEELWDKLINTAKKHGLWSAKRVLRGDKQTPKQGQKRSMLKNRAPHGAQNTLKPKACALWFNKTDPDVAAKMLVEFDDKEHGPLSYFRDPSRGTDAKDKDPLVNAKRFYLSNGKTIGPVNVDDATMEASNFYEITDKGLRPKYRELAEHMWSKYSAVTDDSATYLYKDTHFEEISPQGLDALIYRKTGGIGSPAHLSQFAKFIRSNCYRKDFFDTQNEGFLNLSNGYLNVKTKELIPHDPEHRQTITLPTAFDPLATCHKWEAFLLQIFMGDESLCKLAKQVFGYVLLGGRPFLQKAFVLHGTGHNGKSTLIEIMQALIGENNFSSVSLKKLDTPFSVIMLKNKVVNLTEETPSETINAEAFKAAVGGAYMTAAHKGVDEFQMRCNARFIFACNQMPVMKDSSIGMLRRLVFLPFNYYIPDEMRDPEIGDKLKEELSGILNWALAGADEVLFSRKLNEVDAVDDLKEEYKRESDSVYEFFCDHIKLSSSDYISKAELWRRYREWCMDEGVINGVQQKTLTRKIREYAKAAARKLGWKIDKNTFRDNTDHGLKVISAIGFK